MQETLLIVLPYNEDKVIQRVKFIGPWGIKLQSKDLAIYVKEQVGDNVHWQITGVYSWSKVIKNLKTALESAVKGKVLDDGVALAVETLITVILDREGKRNV